MQLWKFENKNKKYRWTFKEKNRWIKSYYIIFIGLMMKIAKLHIISSVHSGATLQGVMKEWEIRSPCFIDIPGIQVQGTCGKDYGPMYWFPSVFSACVFRTGEQALPTPNPWMLVFGKWSQMEKSKHLSSPVTGLYGMN